MARRVSVVNPAEAAARDIGIAYRRSVGRTVDAWRFFERSGGIDQGALEDVRREMVFLGDLHRLNSRLVGRR
jgi:hypothetical protein